MSILFHRSCNRIPRHWIHTSSVFNAEKASLTKGRSKTVRKQYKLPDSFLETHYVNHGDLEKFKINYSTFIDVHSWKELEWSCRSSLTPKGSMAGLNHTDHLELVIPHSGASYFTDYLAIRLAKSVKSDLLFLDSLDFITIAQQAFPVHPVSILPSISAQDMYSNALLTVKQLPEEPYKEEKQVKAEYEDYDVSDLLAVVENEKADKTTISLLNQVSQRYSQMFKNVLASNTSKIIYLKQYETMQDAFSRLMLKSLVTAVEDLKQKGHSMMILASNKTSIKEEFVPILNHIRSTTILPPTQLWDSWKERMNADMARKTGITNARAYIAFCIQKNALPLDQNEVMWIAHLKNLSGISDSVWTLQDIDRRVAVAIGHASENGNSVLTLSDLKVAHAIVSETSQASEKKLKLLEKTVSLSAIKESANKYEKKLLSRIVDPNSVQGSFKDIRAPQSTVETLQSLISLPLVRPDLFQTGILKNNFIPGVLLFGPPGTGKTMLAKAVAKESGSRMLDIQASDIYDMYVGQGEKNVRAIFSLARKLSPCVIFIDEVDSLMSKRGSDHSSKSHREIINQFMVEWDGLSSHNQGVIVMAATNRPFDLDDAVMRRMPRRILVDLPNEQDRLEILKMLTKDEKHDLFLSELARSTNHYSGSDLKNVCVAAALKAVQEQVKSGVSVKLNMNHFKQALKMVQPSSSEEMGSLVEIRKWDQKFGDGKKKPKTNIGFS